MRGAAVEVWLGDGEIHELARLRRQSSRPEPAARRRPVLALARWLAALRTRLAPIG